MLDGYQNILVAVDGSEQADKAFEESLAIAKNSQAKLYIAIIINDADISNSAYAYTKVLDAEMEFAKNKAADKIRLAESEGVTNTVSIVELGSPKQLISSTLPEKHNIDLIVIGVTGKGRIQRMLVGSTTAFVVNHAPCNVLVVK
ncbi:universal stress protein [Enterococcus sp. HY326]|uniref:universal stress protein n=1 Tax=Enterococcus sp. HY326 TaxID=2971265 RepID=UPI00223F0AE9|nr:universal stress protein [Enterococcus sp. HY326]